MRLPHFYQQMLGYFAVILTLLYISLFAFYHFTRNNIIDRTEQTLENYAESLIVNVQSGEDLSREQRFLENQNLSFFVTDPEHEVHFPQANNINDFGEFLNEEAGDTLRSGETLTTTFDVEITDAEGGPVEAVLVCVPYFDQNTDEYGGFVGVSTPLSQVAEQVDELERQLFRAFLISTILAVLLSALISRHQVNRINRLRKAAKKVSAGQYDVRLEHNDRDELDNLTRDFNKMILELEEASKEVEKQEERRKTFMQDAAHEMRTPLTTINGLLEGMEHGVIDEENQLRSIQLMSKETKRLIRLVNENLDYENIRSNHIKLEKDHIPLSEIFEEVGYQMNKLAEKSNNELIIDDIENLTVYADFDRLKQILVNLIKNAIQFTDNGKVVIYADKTDLGTIIYVQDTGIGMSEEETQNIWERYYKADDSRKNTKYGESGLGLSIVLQLVRLHDAKMNVNTKVGEGTVFSIEFPDSTEQAEKLNKKREEDIIEE